MAQGTTTDEQVIPAHVQMMQLAFGHMRAQAVLVAARLGIADLLRDGPKSVETLAGATNSHAPSLRRLLRALASLGVFAEDDCGRFALNALAATLTSDSPSSVLPALRLAGSDFHWSAWSNLGHAVATGECAFESVRGQRFFDYLAEHPEAAATFDAWMTRLSQMQMPAILEKYDFSGCRVVVDVGGGHGRLVSAVLCANPGIRGILFDIPTVIAEAREPESAGVKDRCEMVGGDMFASVPEGGDLYMLKTVIHDWDDDLSVKILGNCRRVMKPDTRLLLIESIIAPANMPDPAKIMDLNMLVLNHGGRERNEGEFRALLQGSGFELTRIIRTRSALCLVEAKPI